MCIYKESSEGCWNCHDIDKCPDYWKERYFKLREEVES